MSRWTPCKRRKFIQRLIRLGFEGPFPGTRHQFMIYGEYRLAIPSNDEFAVPEVRFMLREVAEVIGRQLSVEEWNNL